jgi:hypothetical protein
MFYRAIERAQDRWLDRQDRDQRELMRGCRRQRTAVEVPRRTVVVVVIDFRRNRGVVMVFAEMPVLERSAGVRVNM